MTVHGGTDRLNRIWTLYQAHRFGNRHRPATVPSRQAAIWVATHDVTRRAAHPSMDGWIGCLRRLSSTRSSGVQVLHAFYVNVTRKIRTPVSRSEARAVVGTCIPWCLEPETRDINEAFRIEDEAGISLWDALIVAAAARSGATRVLSEDLNPGQVIAGVTVVNPFEDSAEPPDAGNR